MKIKDIAKAVCTYLNKTEIIEYLDGTVLEPTQDVLTQVDILTRLTNLVINELACSYVPMTTLEKVTVRNGKIKIASLSKQALKINSVRDLNGNGLIFSAQGEYITTYGDAVEVEYTYLPENYGLEDQIGYLEAEVSLAVLSFGVCAEYCLTEWRFEEAVMWRERYVTALKTFTLPENKMMKGRDWL